MYIHLDWLRPNALLYHYFTCSYAALTLHPTPHTTILFDLVGFVISLFVREFLFSPLFGIFLVCSLLPSLRVYSPSFLLVLVLFLSFNHFFFNVIIYFNVICRLYSNCSLLLLLFLLLNFDVYRTETKTKQNLFVCLFLLLKKKVSFIELFVYKPKQQQQNVC